ncbi:MAG TPA: hypothetical protein VIM41_00020 [Gammaproteobacteria bacterium]
MKNLKRRIFLAAIPVLALTIVWLGANSSDSELKKPQQLTKPLFLPKNVNGTSESQVPSASIERTSNSDIETTDSLSVVNSQPVSASNPELDSKLAAIEDELRKLQDTINDMISNAKSQTGGALDPALQQQLSDIAVQREQLAYEYIQNTFASEAIDPAWDAEANSKISAGLAKMESLSSSAVECASTMCRINAVTSGEDNNAMGIMHSLNNELDWQGQMYITINHQSGEMTAYLARPGNTLPAVVN